MGSGHGSPGADIKNDSTCLGTCGTVRGVSSTCAAVRIRALHNDVFETERYEMTTAEPGTSDLELAHENDGGGRW